MQWITIRSLPGHLRRLQANVRTIRSHDVDSLCIYN